MESRKDSGQLNHDLSTNGDTGPALSQPKGRVYQIIIRGLLNDDWSDWFDGLEMARSANGNTVLSGTIVDQAALMGVLNKLNRLNATLLALSQVDSPKQG